jgi:hypothetical protein
MGSSDRFYQSVLEVLVDFALGLDALFDLPDEHGQMIQRFEVVSIDILILGHYNELPEIQL